MLHAGYTPSKASNAYLTIIFLRPVLRIRIQVISLRFTEFFFDKKFQILVLFFAYFILRLDEPFRKEETLIISLFKSSDLVFGSKKDFFCKFWSIFYPLDPDPRIRIFCGSGSGSRKPKSWGSNGSGS